MDALTAGNLIEAHQEKLVLQWVAGQQGCNRPVQPSKEKTDQDSPFSSWVGYLNLIHPNRIQILGRLELQYLDNLGKNSHADAIKQLFGSEPAFIVIASGEAATDELKEFAEKSATPLLSSELPGQKLIDYLQYYLSSFLAEGMTMHGVFMEVMGIGVLLTGVSGIGKSEIALELISHGHRLIADDAPLFSRIAPEKINGTCPPALSGFLEVRGIGVLNIREMFGDSAIKPNKNLRLIVHLEHMNDEELWKIDRLGGSRQNVKLLDVDIPQVTIPVAPGRNLSVLVEGAVRNHILFLKGYNAAQDFIDKQRRLIEEGDA